MWMNSSFSVLSSQIRSTFAPVLCRAVPYEENEEDEEEDEEEEEEGEEEEEEEGR